jgi:DNA-binding CsgD family transcriptional regulator
MEIPPLTADELGSLLHRALDRPITDRARRRLAHLSGGNLQVLTELVRAARERGVLTESDGAWDLTGPLPTTAALEELVAEHLAGVRRSVVPMLELLSVCERVGLVDVERAYGAENIDWLESEGLIAIVTSGRRVFVRLAHPLYGEVLRAGLSPLRLRRIQSELADMVEGHGARRRQDVVQLALWRVASGGTVASDWLMRAARLALAAHDPALAVQLLTKGDTAAVSRIDRAEVLVEAHSMSGDLEQLARVVESVWDLELPDTRRAHLAMRLADLRFSRDNDLEGALATHELARQRMSDTEAIAAVDARRASLLAGAGRPIEALRVADAVGEVGSTRTRVELAGARATSLLSCGRFEEAKRISRQAAADHAELPGWLARRGIAQHIVNEAHAFGYAGRFAEARAVLEPAIERAKATGATAALVWFEMVLAEVSRDSGRAHETIRRSAEVAELAPTVGQHAVLVWAHVGVAQGHLLLGQCAEAAAALERSNDVGESPVATSYATRERTAAWLDACRGDLQSARQRIRTLIGPVRDDCMPIFEMALLHDLVRLGVPEQALDRLEALVPGIEGPMAPIHLAHARAAVAADPEALRRVVDEYEAIDALTLAAEAAAELAELHRRRAESRLATAAAHRSAEIAERAGGLHTPPLKRGAGVEPLTGREREVALLAAGGRSSREIGEGLGLSIRTVDTHLARVYRKLGIAGRSDLPGALDR